MGQDHGRSLCIVEVKMERKSRQGTWEDWRYTVRWIRLEGPLRRTTCLIAYVVLMCHKYLFTDYIRLCIYPYLSSSFFHEKKKSLRKLPLLEINTVIFSLDHSPEIPSPYHKAAWNKGPFQVRRSYLCIRLPDTF